ncbi:hypothetical protein EES43_24335 [Streptomyces sp. ADI96-02]|uniref:hypothetical protein n=1 Tax=Streptomyces sp. ADI96-02 TaxID=1522760 RepID=UPI000F54F394|nr:hypothetical protein [Streptomyces sp. ADI96-02]RPK56173.1 hypothetical protein EES43_24335 [Streptomyces sp. ADI96-02]
MPDTTPDRPADQLRAAAVRARETGDPLHTALAPLLEAVAVDAISCRCVPECPTGAALAVARQLLGTTTCGPVPDSCGDEPCANHEREQAHAEGEHAFCRAECATDLADDYASCPGYEASPNLCRCPCYGCKHHCSTHQPPAAPPAPADRAAVLTEAERTMLTYALDEAQEHIWSRDGFTDEDQAAVTSLRRLAGEAAAGAHHPTTTRSYRLEHRHPEESTWRPNTPGIGANWSWRSREKADQRLAEAQDRWPDFEHRLIETTTTVTEAPAVPAAPEETTWVGATELASDRAATRDRIRRAICEASGFTWLPDDLVIELCEATNTGRPTGWPELADRDGDIWAITSETHDGDTVLMPCSGDMGPMLRRDVEAHFGPLTTEGAR